MTEPDMTMSFVDILLSTAAIPALILALWVAAVATRGIRARMWARFWDTNR